MPAGNTPSPVSPPNIRVSIRTQPECANLHWQRNYRGRRNRLRLDSPARRQCFIRLEGRYRLVMVQSGGKRNSGGIDDPSSRWIRPGDLS